MPRQHRRSRVALVVLAVCLVACGPAGVTDADRQFVSLMIPHHQQGIELIEIGRTRSDDVRLRRLIFEMGSYHHSDMHDLEDLAAQWSVRSLGRFPGDVGDDTMRSLGTMEGSDFDAAWLDAMIAHHEGALVISREALESGSASTNIADIARKTISVQSSEIVEMIRLRKSECERGPAC